MKQGDSVALLSAPQFATNRHLNTMRDKVPEPVPAE